MAAGVNVSNEVADLVNTTEFGEEHLRLESFIESFLSPEVVRLVRGESDNLELTPAPLDQPFLAFSRRRRTRMYAECWCWDDKQKKYIAKPPVLEIPKDYVGMYNVYVHIQ